MSTVQEGEVMRTLGNMDSTHRIIKIMTEANNFAS